MMMFLGMMSSAMSGGSFCRDGHGALGGTLTDHVLVELRDDLARGQLVEREVLFFGGCGEVDSHNWKGPAKANR
jgi:hypothetical protein